MKKSIIYNQNDGAHVNIPENVRKVSDQVLSVAQFIYENPELSSEEFKSSRFVIDTLRKEGLAVEESLLKMDTAFVCSFGSGPHVMVMAEYDALPNGHACGHNLISAWAVGVGLALRNDPDFKGKLSIVGTPAEEGSGPYASSKAVIGPEMKKRGVEAVFAVHGEHYWAVGEVRFALQRLRFIFSGREVHPGHQPDLGLSALDAAVEFYIALKMLRSLVKRDEDVVLGAVITDGGKTPNLVPARAEVAVDVRCLSTDYLEDLIQRVSMKAEMSAKLTGCTVVRERTSPVMLPAKRWSELDSIVYRNLTKYVECESPDITWTKPPFAATDYGNISQILPSVHLAMNIAPPGVSPHSLRFKEFANPKLARDPLLIAISTTYDSIKEYTSKPRNKD